jgi:dimethylaniline monooxygenase (N-oxide forming)
MFSQFTDFPSDEYFSSEHPTAEEILKYLQAAVHHYELDVRLNCNVSNMELYPEGWLVEYCINGVSHSQLHNYVVVSSGLFTKGAFYPVFPGQSEYKGELHLGPFINDLNCLRDKKVTIVGYVSMLVT